ncbi:MAG: ATP-binding cassette domain-containing protein [Eubacteriales bacterium]|nr:ATP-binding cassette domain-containing protein [Eubacteriales bacterium]
MAQICVSDLTFYYENSFDNIFEKVSFSIDTDWKLGLIGRNGKGKTTFLNLLLGKYEYQGSISTSTVFDYFPYSVLPEDYGKCAVEFYEELKAGSEFWRILCELEKLEADAEILYRPFETLSHGERTKVMLAVLFSGENEFLLIDEPTNHLDQASREIVKRYLGGKRGFILVSHDRDLLDACVDHVLVLNRNSIEVQSGNFSSWWENKNRKDAFSQRENEKHKKEIVKLKKASERTKQWADKNEGTKIGFDPVKEHDRCIATRSFIGAKTKKMQSRVKQMEYRIDREIEEKEGLLKDIETPAELKLSPLEHYKNVLISAKEYGLKYQDAETPVFENLNLEVQQGERIFLNGKNGCGKSSLIKAILANAAGNAAGNTVENAAGNAAEDAKCGQKPVNPAAETGTLRIAPNLVISYINQDTSFLKGDIRHFCRIRNLEESLFCAILRQLDMGREQFAKNMKEFSEGQKKKVLIAASLMTPAHLYIWDEPLNYIDVFSRMQLEKLILAYHPTMLVVEHDVRFREQIATRVIEM